MNFKKTPVASVVSSHTLPVRQAGSKDKPDPVQQMIRQMLPLDVQLCQQIAYRLRDIARQHRYSSGRPDPILEMNPAVIAIDLAVVHCLRHLDLPRMLSANQLALIAEHGRIQQNIVRTPFPFFPAECMLAFARNGSRINQ